MGEEHWESERHCLQKAPSLPHDRFEVHSYCLKTCASPEFKSLKIKGILQNYVLEYPRSSTFSVLLNLDWSSFKNPHTIVFTRHGFDLWSLVLPGKQRNLYNRCPLSFLFFLIIFLWNPERWGRVVNVSNFTARHLSPEVCLTYKKPNPNKKPYFWFNTKFKI